jgi:hypothetical protein
MKEKQDANRKKMRRINELLTSNKRQQPKDELSKLGSCDSCSNE